MKGGGASWQIIRIKIKTKIKIRIRTQTKTTTRTRIRMTTSASNSSDTQKQAAVFEQGGLFLCLHKNVLNFCIRGLSEI